MYTSAEIIKSSNGRRRRRCRRRRGVIELHRNWPIGNEHAATQGRRMLMRMRNSGRWTQQTRRSLTVRKSSRPTTGTLTPLLWNVYFERLDGGMKMAKRWSARTGRRRKHRATSSPPGLRSASHLLYRKTALKTKVGERAFSHATPAAWNSLPYCIQSESNTKHFKKLLKTYLFASSF